MAREVAARSVPWHHPNTPVDTYYKNFDLGSLEYLLEAANKNDNFKYMHYTGEGPPVAPAGPTDYLAEGFPTFYSWISYEITSIINYF